MACCAVQSFCRIPSRFDYRLDHARCGEACLVSKAAVWTLFGVWRGKLDVFRGYFSALVWRIAQSVAAAATALVGDARWTSIRTRVDWREALRLEICLILRRLPFEPSPKSGSLGLPLAYATLIPN